MASVAESRVSHIKTMGNRFPTGGRGSVTGLRKSVRSERQQISTTSNEAQSWEIFCLFIQMLSLFCVVTDGFLRGEDLEVLIIGVYIGL